MKVLLMANNWGGLQVTRWLAERGEDVVALVTHPAANSKFRTEILEAARPFNCTHIDADFLRELETLREIKGLAPDIGITAFFGYILKPALFNILPKGVVNLHPAYLPHNKGWHPNVYPFLDGSPPGVTLHYIDEFVDGGDMIAWRYVKLEPYDTGGTLHQRLTRELVDLFKGHWPSITAGTSTRVKQNGKEYGVHLRHEMRQIERINLDETYTARHLLGLLRGLTYPPYPAAYYMEDGQRVYIRVELFGEDGLNKGELPKWD